MKIKDNISLIVGLSIPLLMILFVGLSIYLPGLFVKPGYGFLYASGGDYHSIKQYAVKNGKIIEVEVNYPERFSGAKIEPKLYVYNVSKDNSWEISFEEAEKLNLDDSTKSPDGFEVVSGGYGGDIFYSRGGYYKKYIKGHNFSKELNLKTSSTGSDSSYWSDYRSFKFIGWIEE
ncbi:MAG: hypothetical protein ABIA97_03575 [Candidatus Omnitrophota bacterium]